MLYFIASWCQTNGWNQLQWGTAVVIIFIVFFNMLYINMYTCICICTYTGLYSLGNNYLMFNNNFWGKRWPVLLVLPCITNCFPPLFSFRKPFLGVWGSIYQTIAWANDISHQKSWFIIVSWVINCCGVIVWNCVQVRTCR